MRDVEFVPGPPDDSDGSEELGGSGRRRIPPWLIITVLVVVATIVVVSILNRAGRPSAEPTPSISAVGPSPSAPQRSTVGDQFNYRVPPPQGVGQPFQLGFSAHVFDVALTAQGVWALTDNGLVQLMPDGNRRVMGLGDAQLPPLATSGAARLVVDPPAGLIWVVVNGMRGGRAVAYNLNRGGPIADLVTPPISDAAALGGRLYIISDHLVFAVAPGRAIRTVAALPDRLGILTADPSRGRLLVLDYSQRIRIWSIVPTATGRVRVSAPTRVRIFPSGLVVADGRIWLGGFDPDTLLRLGPSRLRVVPHTGIRDQFMGSVVPVAAGDSVIWVRDADGTVLHCLDARTGRDLQDWDIDGPVASRTGQAVVASGVGLVPLQLSACRG